MMNASATCFIHYVPFSRSGLWGPTLTLGATNNVLFQDVVTHFPMRSRHEYIKMDRKYHWETSWGRMHGHLFPVPKDLSTKRTDFHEQFVRFDDVSSRVFADEGTGKKRRNLRMSGPVCDPRLRQSHARLAAKRRFETFQKDAIMGRSWVLCARPRRRGG